MAMRHPTGPETERRALKLFEHLADRPGNSRLRERLLKNEPEEVLTRLAALEDSVTRAQYALPTLIPGSADCDGLIPPPDHIGAFRLTERIGRGGMGDVWLGQRDDGLYDQKVAIKLIQRHALQRAAGAFDEERRLLARLEHPNIARLIDGGVTDDGLPWLAMEYIDGKPIDEACASLGAKDRVALLIKAADAVQFAHSRMIAHADLKPGNILVDREGRVKLLDFGIAGLIGADGPRETGSGPLTREFASPQRIAGGRPSVPDDVFALGKTLSLILTSGGVSPDPELVAIAHKANEAEEADRYPSAAALIADLDLWRQNRPVSAMHDGWSYRVGKFAARHRFGVTATALAALALVATGLFASVSYFRAETASARSMQRLQEVRQLAKYMLYDLHDELARQPGTLAKRIELATVASRYLDQLRTARDAPAGLRLEVAQGYRRLATIQGLGGGINLGNAEAARKTTDISRALLDELIAYEPRNAAALAERGWIELGYWTLGADNADSIKVNARAKRYFEQALAFDASLPEARLGLLNAGSDKAFDLTLALDKPGSAIPILKDLRVQLRQEIWPQSLRARAEQLEIQLLNRLGDAVYFAGDVPASLSHYDEANQIIDQLIKREGGIPVLLMLKGETAFNRSGTLQELDGRLADSLRVVNSGLDALAPLKRHALDAGTEKRIIMLLGQKAIILGEMGRYREAVIPSSESMAIRKKRRAASPNDPHRVRDVGIAMANHAKILDAAGDRKAACATMTEAVALWEYVKERGNLSAKDARAEVPQSGTLQKKFCAP